MLEKMRERAKVLNTLLLQKGSEYWIECNSKWKNNSETYCYSLVNRTLNASPVIHYNEDWYSRTDDEVMEFLDRVYAEYARKVDVPDMTFEFICSNIMPKIVSSDNISAMDSNNISHWDIENTDLTLCFYIPVDSMSANKCNASLQVTNANLASVGLDKKEAYEYAMQNLESEITIRTMEEIISKMFDLSEEEFMKDDNYSMYVISNKNGFNGASAIISNTAMNRAKEMIGCDELIILPSSIHECILIPFKDKDLYALLDMVKEINSTEVQSEDVLTNNVYIYRNNQIIPLI